KEHRTRRAAGIALVCPRQPDNVESNAPHKTDQPATKWNHQQWIDRANRKANDAESSFERLISSAHDHQANVQNGGNNKDDDQHAQRGQNYPRNRAETAQQLVKRAMPRREKNQAAKRKPIKEIEHRAEGAA